MPAVSIVDEKTIANGPTQMTVVVETKPPSTPDILTTPETRNFVLTAARARGFPAKGLGGIPSPYPIDDKGETDDDLVLGRRPLVAWRADYQVSAGIG
jgi:hypothetical protein